MSAAMQMSLTLISLNGRVRRSSSYRGGGRVVARDIGVIRSRARERPLLRASPGAELAPFLEKISQGNEKDATAWRAIVSCGEHDLRGCERSTDRLSELPAEAVSIID